MLLALGLACVQGEDARAGAPPVCPPRVLSETVKALRSDAERGRSMMKNDTARTNTVVARSGQPVPDAPPSWDPAKIAQRLVDRRPPFRDGFVSRVQEFKRLRGRLPNPKEVLQLRRSQKIPGFRFKSDKEFSRYREQVLMLLAETPLLIDRLRVLYGVREVTYLGEGGFRRVFKMQPHGNSPPFVIKVPKYWKADGFEEGVMEAALGFFQKMNQREMELARALEKRGVSVARYLIPNADEQVLGISRVEYLDTPGNFSDVFNLPKDPAQKPVFQLEELEERLMRDPQFKEVRDISARYADFRNEDVVSLKGYWSNGLDQSPAIVDVGEQGRNLKPREVLDGDAQPLHPALCGVKGPNAIRWVAGGKCWEAVFTDL